MVRRYAGINVYCMRMGGGGAVDIEGNEKAYEITNYMFSFFFSPRFFFRSSYVRCKPLAGNVIRPSSPGI